ncbi:alcohol dehydrogenase catalytic domain-containing protein [Infirmifilum lucidum]|uniref:Alcohol dehydrogenase catalytic domain-containing protein n=1 Tax=Infirmifilum lucidum TaxID=2776706 RepID=A0A7L9FH01_9CREN|nr:alcohol dehydrogenase catalytic domain-containing protein [Infirmifilum lucidum]QOJ78997.1 alcohol dehydrogenase catalytic domain-containing protein [Infirmifilum lucidum]
MKAVRLYGPRDLRVEEVEDPKPPEGWALVKTEAVGICGTDKAFYSGTYPLFKKPITLGHEVAGTVVKGPGELLGRLVVSEINFPCWKCELCRSGLYTHCPYKKTLGIDFDGGMAEYFVAPVTALHDASGLDPVMATFAEPLAAVLNALAQFPVRAGDRVAILGSGNIAYLLAQVLKEKGVWDAAVVVRDGSPKAKYFGSVGLDVVPLSALGDYMREASIPGFDVVFEATGSTSALDLAIDIARPRGVIHLKSTPGGVFQANLTKAVVKELRIVGTRCGTFREFRLALDMLKTGRVKPLATAVLDGLENAPRAFEKAFERDQVKVVLRL